MSVGVRWSKTDTERRASEKKQGKGWNGTVRTHSNVVNVPFTLTASARLEAPAPPILLAPSLVGVPRTHHNSHADGSMSVGVQWSKTGTERRAGEQTGNRLERHGSHSLQRCQRPVHLDRIRKAGGSRVADLVAAKADRVPPNTPQLPRGRQHVSRGAMVEDRDREESW
jgi:hypothetical protein